MSLLGKFLDVGKSILNSPVAKVAGTFLGGVPGALLAGASTAYGAYQALKTPSAGAVLPGAGSVSTLSSMPSLSMGMSPTSMAGLGSAVRVGGRLVVTGIRGVAKGAANLCRKYPQWCATIGGTAAVEALMHSGQLPVPKRSRGRGITAHELRAFKRVARFTSKYCAPVHKAMRAPAVRRGGKSSCR